MAFEVTFTKRAEDDFEDILNYIENEFGTKTAIHFKDLIIEFATLIQSFPEIGSLERSDKNIRGLVILRRLKVFYRIKKDNIIVLRLFDTRQHRGRI
ncbi:type II toxin-antitoxin system RelE/ParE family toxin [Mucilaginibacter sp. UYCu711]|uniref:type II toxin-antitoxin system RelE/ParE family toxin n=1 Tax=Mucilaginibacter sp. UYCu711 TaxID=3156339 RepID=UPI003D1FA6A4